MTSERSGRTSRAALKALYQVILAYVVGYSADVLSDIRRASVIIAAAFVCEVCLFREYLASVVISCERIGRMKKGID